VFARPEEGPRVKFEYIFFAVFGLVVLNLLYRVVKNRGFRGAMFGAAVARTVGEVDLGRRGMVRTRLKVHSLEAREDGSPEVGIEFVATTIGSFSMTPLSLTRDQAHALSTLLSQAATEAGPRR
jgi:hypothetical protein